MEIDLLFESALCGAVCFAEIFVGILATRCGRMFLLSTKIMGLIFDGLVVYPYMVGATSDGGGTYLLLYLIVWERFAMIFILGKKFLCCKLFGSNILDPDDPEAKKCSTKCSLRVHRKYLEYVELTATKYEQDKEEGNNCSCGTELSSKEAMKDGLIVLYWGAFFNTTDYLGSIWKSDHSKYCCFGTLYWMSVMYITVMGYCVMFVERFDGDFSTRLLVGLTLYLNTLGVLQHWLNFSTYFVKKRNLRRKAEKERKARRKIRKNSRKMSSSKSRRKSSVKSPMEQGIELQVQTPTTPNTGTPVQLTPQTPTIQTPTAVQTVIVTRRDTTGSQKSAQTPQTVIVTRKDTTGSQKSVQAPQTEIVTRKDTTGSQKSVQTPQTPQTPQTDDNLPDGWRVAFTEDGKKYYQNDSTQQTQWTSPHFPVVVVKTMVETAPTVVYVDQNGMKYAQLSCF